MKRQRVLSFRAVLISKDLGGRGEQRDVEENHITHRSEISDECTAALVKSRENQR